MLFILCLILTSVLSVCSSERRIFGGKQVDTDHPFMVYLQKAEDDDRKYSGWLCGGVIVKPNVVLTSAACVEDVQHLYVIAGYKNYVDEKTEKDECIETMSKKVIKVCVPKAYDLNYDKLATWANYDIALIKVESNIVGDPGYETHCSYAPKVMNINYDDEKLQQTGVDAEVYGWGHNKSMREANDTQNYNQKILHFARTKVYNKTKCLEKYSKYKMELVIKKYMICTQDSDTGAEDDIVNPIPKDGCSDEKPTTRRKRSSSEEDAVGICQNDHGGPLIAWSRHIPMVIGIASAFKTKDNNDCIGPSLYTSTYCSSNFLRCVIDGFESEDKGQMQEKQGRKFTLDYCNEPAEKQGFEIIQRSISWTDHPDGPADNEQILIREQKPLHDFS